MKNNRGFTLVELLATLVVLSIIVSITGYTIITTINKSKEENYNVLVKNIVSAAESYYLECKYNNNTTSNGITCSNTVTLGNLVRYGYLSSNKMIYSETGAKVGEMGLINPKNDEDITSCRITISYSQGKVTITSLGGDNCPTTDEYSR